MHLVPTGPGLCAVEMAAFIIMQCPRCGEAQMTANGSRMAVHAARATEWFFRRQGAARPRAARAAAARRSLTSGLLVIAARPSARSAPVFSAVLSGRPAVEPRPVCAETWTDAPFLFP